MYKGKKQLVTSDNAMECTEQIKKPCSDCPWSRKSLKGWLGDNSAQEWAELVRGETMIDCHALKGTEGSPGPQCAGAAIMRSNVCKLPRNRDILRLPSDKGIVFSTFQEFLDHHSKPRLD